MQGEGRQPTDAQRRVAAHRDGPLLVTGPAGSGRSEALALRIASLAASGVAPERVLVLTCSRTAAARLRERAEELLAHGYEELWVMTYEAAAERLLREHALEAELDPFFATVRLTDRLAILLDRLDDLPLRRHEIRGNPAGLLARLLRRIDALKAHAVTPERFRDWAERAVREARPGGDRERARRELEFAAIYARHEALLRERASLDAGELVLELERLLAGDAGVRQAVLERFPYVMADELEDAGAAQRALLERLAGERENLVCACDPMQAVRLPRAADAAAAFRRRHPGAPEVELGAPVRFGAGVAAVAAVVSGQGAPAAGADGAVRLWRCSGERAQAQAAAREAESLLAGGRLRPEDICIVVGSAWRDGRVAAAALEERAIPYRFAGDAALYARPEVRDVIAWLRLLADPTDSAAVVRALTRPPVELRSIDLARCTTIARRRKLDMISAVEAALESPQLPPEARDRIQAFLKLQGSAAAALERLPADVFVRRLIERIGMRRHRLFAATPDAAERLQSLSRLAEVAATWTRHAPRGSVRDFVRHLTAVADAAELESSEPAVPGRGAVLIAEPAQVKGLEFEHVLLLGAHRGAIPELSHEERWVPPELIGEGEAPPAGRRRRLAYLALTRARSALVLAWPQETAEGRATPAPFYEAVRDALGLAEEEHADELFGPAEGLHSAYRMLRDEALEASWRAGAALSEMRLDTAEDVNRAVARYLELIKLAAVVQRPGTEPVAEVLAGLNELLRRAASPEQWAELEASALDALVTGEERERAARRELIAARSEPSLEQFLPRRGDGLALSASDIELYRTCPLKYKFARVFAIPQEPTINQRFGILIHQVLERFHAEEARGAARLGGAEPGSLERLLAIFEAGWRRAGFGSSDDELQYRDRAVAALTRYHERHRASGSRPVWLERGFAFAIGPHHLRGRVDRVDRLPDGGYEVIDYKTGQPKGAAELEGDVQLALYRMAAREAWRIEASAGAYWYVLEDERVPVPAQPDDPERVERTVLEVAAGIEGQDFEPRPSYEICSWCDYRLICPASEA